MLYQLSYSRRLRREIYSLHRPLATDFSRPLHAPGRERSGALFPRGLVYLCAVRARPLALALLVLASCSPTGPGGKDSKVSGPVISCPAPIGAIPKEDCAEIADDFGAFQLKGALGVAGSGKEADLRIEAIKEAENLASTLKEQRVSLCEEYVKCKVSVSDRDAQDQVLAGGMRALIDLWKKRNFSRTDQIMRFRDGVRAISAKVAPPAEGAASAIKPSHNHKGDDVFERMEDPEVVFKVETGSVSILSNGTGKHDAVRSKADSISLQGGHRYRVRVVGKYKPNVEPLVKPGDELTARLRYRASSPTELTLALRSVEDPEASEGAETWQATPGDKGAREAKLTADPQSTGFYLGVAVKGAPIDLDDIELLRGGQPLAVSRAEAPNEPHVKTDCETGKGRPISGSKSWHCNAGEGDRITLGRPEGFLQISVKDRGGDRGTLRTLSLEGGRSIDALLKEDGQIVVSLVGAGSATLERIEITEL